MKSIDELPPLGAHIRSYRKANRYSLSELAEMAGMTKSHLWEIETGASINPTISLLAGIARATQTTVARVATLAAQPYKDRP